MRPPIKNSCKQELQSAGAALGGASVALDEDAADPAAGSRVDVPPTLPGMEAAAMPSPPTERKAKKGDRLRKLSDAQVETRKAFLDWWIVTWPRFHDGADFEFKGNRDAPAALLFLSKQTIGWDLDWAKQVALHYLAKPEMYGLADHPLYKLAHGANGYSRELKRLNAEGGSHVIGIATSHGTRPGEIPSNLPLGIRNVDDAGRPIRDRQGRRGRTPEERGELTGPTGGGDRPIPKFDRAAYQIPIRRRPTAAERGEYGGPTGGGVRALPPIDRAALAAAAATAGPDPTAAVRGSGVAPNAGGAAGGPPVDPAAVGQRRAVG